MGLTALRPQAFDIKNTAVRQKEIRTCYKLVLYLSTEIYSKHARKWRGIKFIMLTIIERRTALEWA